MAPRSRLAARLGEPALVAGFATAALVVLALHRAGDPWSRSHWAEILGLLLLLGAAIGGRRRHAFAVLIATCAFAWVDPSSAAVTLPVLVATANVAYRCEHREIAVAALLAGAASIAAPALEGTTKLTAGWGVSHLVAIGLATAAGMYLAARRANLDALHERASQLERERELLTEQAVAAERVRIARELHDVVAHGVSLMVVQAQALGALAGAERDAAGDAIARAGREALTEMHRMLGVLRPQADEAPALAPAPGVRDVPGLVERARGAGIDVSLTIEGRPRDLPAGVDLSAYRIVQEALTNVIKHARALRTEVRLRYGADELELSVLDDGRGEPGPGAPGHGLVGMRERVALFGGTLETGRRGDAPGFAVRAVLPL